MSRYNACRLCLSSDANIISIFDNVFASLSIEEKIFNYLSFRVKQSNDLPNGICEICLKNLNNFHDFAEKVYLTQRQLQNDFKILMYKKESHENSKSNEKSKSERNISKIISQEIQGHKSEKTSKVEITSYQILAGITDKTKSEFPVHNNDDDAEPSCIDKNDSTKCDNINKKDFPKQIVKDCKLVITGNKLSKLLARFFNLECYICTEIKVFKSLAALFNHYTIMHDSKGYILCCGQKLYKSKSMALHMASHLQPEAFTCDICGKILTCPRILQSHRQNHLPEAERPLGCSHADCTRRFSYHSALLSHEISHLPKNQKQQSHVCDECGKSFRTSAILSTHLNNVHRTMTKSAQFVCHICARQFNNSSNLDYHLSTHEHRMINQMQCTECGKWSKNKQCLAKHMVRHRSAPFTCNFCPYASKTRPGLRSHVLVHHTKEKQHCCKICGKKFKMKCTLKAHFAQHTGERKYHCTFCTRSFVNSGNFYAHRKRMHPVQLKDYYAERNRKEQEERVRVLGAENAK